LGRRKLARGKPKEPLILHPPRAASQLLHRPALPFRAVTPSQIAEDRLRRRRERVSFRQVPSAGRPRIRGLSKSFRPQSAPEKSVRPLTIRASRWPDACPPLSRRRARSHRITRTVTAASRQAAHQGLAETSALTAPPKSVQPLAGPGKPLALCLPATHQATAPVSPGRQKSE
jgi:hypothetical protein